jgi:hypothetical protein
MHILEPPTDRSAQGTIPYNHTGNDHNMLSKNIFITGLLITIGMSLLMLYANLDLKLRWSGITLNKSRELRILPEPTVKRPAVPRPASGKVDTAKSAIDTSAKKILLVGDSEAGGLVFPFADYCRHNGHQMKATLTWASATDMAYANDDTLAGLIRRFQPDYIFMVIGLNQIYQTNFDRSIEAVQKIVGLFGDIPYAWIGPANWVDDYGINDVYANYTHEGSFFLSKHLKLGRGPDGRHPNKEGYRIWMDSIAHWLMTDARKKIRMQKPVSYSSQVDFPLIMLNANYHRKKQLPKPKTGGSDTSGKIETPLPPPEKDSAY